jgi:hypothetical protein
MSVGAVLVLAKERERGSAAIQLSKRWTVMLQPSLWLDYMA